MHSNIKTKINIDFGRAPRRVDPYFDLAIYENLREKKDRQINFSQLLSNKYRTGKFITEDSRRYITPREYQWISKGIKLDRDIKKWDSLSSRIVREYKSYQPSSVGILARSLERRIDAISRQSAEAVDGAMRGFVQQLSLVRLWNLSIVGAILLGMFSMTMIYRYLGQGAAAGNIATEPATHQQIQTDNSDLASADYSNMTEAEKVLSQFDEINDQDKFEQEVRKMVKGYPIEEMLPYIFAKDRKVATYLIAIAKKESNWGKRVPTLEGQDCNNLWGYRAQRNLMGTGGHTCFNSKKDAVDTVAKRLNTLIKEENIDTPSEIVVWKCGRDCNATGGVAAANKWISDVDMYIKKMAD